MTSNEQREFVESICNDLKESLLKKLPKIPEDWDGHEIRQWILDYYSDNYVIGTALSGGRKRDYKNTIIVNNLT